MSEKTPARPRQVTWGATFAIGGSLFLVLSVFEALGRLPSVQLREQVAEAVADSGLAVATDQAITVMRYGLCVTAVSAAVSFVAGIFALQRHHGARWAVTVASVPILLTSPVTGVLMGVLVAMGASLLWSPPSRDWFAGRPIRELPGRGRAESPAPREQAPVPAGRATTPAPHVAASTSTAPPPTQGYGEPAHPQQPPAYAALLPGRSTDRAPGPVRVAAVLTWIGSAVVALAMATVLVTWLVAPEVLRPALVQSTEASGVTLPTGVLDAVVWTMVLMFGGWAVTAGVLAELVRRRYDWARYLLLVSAVLAGLMALFSFPVGLPIVAMCAVTVRLLLVRDTRSWFAGPAAHQPPYQSPQG